MIVNRATRTVALAATTLLSACASIPGEPVEHDPWQGFNRSIYHFNERADTWVLKPVAEIYRDITPEIVQTGIGNFFGNLGDPLIIINDLLQLKFTQLAQDVGRFMLNTTVGVLGILDVATPLGLPKHDEDFGQTLGYWGIEGGPYLVLPFFGPSAVRDAGSLVVDYVVDPVRDSGNSDTWLALDITRTVDARARLLRAESVLDAAAPEDRYSFIRDAWLARRENLVRDGELPEDDVDALDELDELDALDEPDAAV